MVSECCTLAVVRLWRLGRAVMLLYRWVDMQNCPGGKVCNYEARSRRGIGNEALV